MIAALALAAALRVFSLDQCADQYVLALAPREAIVGLSKRADDPDAYLRSAASGLPQRRATLEAVLAERPDLVVRFWGGEPLMLRRLSERGVRVATIEEADDFEAVRRNIRRVAAALAEPGRGEVLIADMDRRLAAAAGRRGGQGALYMTAGGFTAGPGTLIDAILRAAGLKNLAPGPGFRSVSLERLVAGPPAVLALGYFTAADRAANRWAIGRSPIVARLAATRRADRLSGKLLGCPAWFAAEAVEQLARH